MAKAGGTMDTGSPLQGPAAAASFRPLAQVYAYWDALRGGRPLPLRSEVDPRGIESALDHTFILERIAPEVSRFRLAGSRLADLMGMEVRGMPATCLFAAAARAQAASAIDRVFTAPAILEIGLEAETSFGRPALTARLLVLPLRSDLGDVSRALGCLVAEGQIGRAPRRFVITGLRERGLAAGTPALRVVAGAEGADGAVPGLAEPPRRFVPAPGPTLAPGRHLRLVKSDA
ncbi:MAG: PAS domain-containing protein [Rhodobacteraceae bacterium]|nr:PAS domain-containing protein [Paracoccaceae bacterium]